MVSSLYSGWLSGNIYSLIYKSYHFPKWDGFILSLLSFTRFKPVLRTLLARVRLGMGGRVTPMTLCRDKNSEQVREVEVTHYLLG